MGILHKLSEGYIPLKMCGGPVACEPAYITSWESSKLHAPPRLTGYESRKPSGDESFEVPERVEVFRHKGVKLDSAVGRVLQNAAAYDPDSNTWPVAVIPERQDFNQRRHQKRSQKRPQKRRCYLLIATQLRQLENEDPRKLLIVRKINRLGFDSATVLEQHYERYGKVSKVLLSNKHDKDAGADFPVRVRPSGIGYMLFETVEGAAKALAEGPSQIVAGVEITIRAFEKRRQSESLSSDDGVDDADNGWTDSGGSNSQRPRTKSVTDQISWGETVSL